MPWQAVQGVYWHKTLLHPLMLLEMTHKSLSSLYNSAIDATNFWR
jgi:hypothetical protein